MSKKEGYWKTYYVCSICGEHSSFKHTECPFCHNPMKNSEHIIVLCELRNKDKCNMYCDGYDRSCEDYKPVE